MSANTTQLMKPVLTPPWPPKRREQTHWCRFLFDCDPKISQFVNFYEHAVLETAGTVTIRDRHHSRTIMESTFVPLTKEQHDELRLVVREFLMIGYAFGDAGKMLDPDWHDENDGKVVEIPTDHQKRVVWTRHPRAEYDLVPRDMRQKILSGAPYELRNARLIKMPENAQAFPHAGCTLPAPGTPGSMIKAMDEAFRVIHLSPEMAIESFHEYGRDARSALCDWADAFMPNRLLCWVDPVIKQAPLEWLS